VTRPPPARVLGIDWSGALAGARDKIWLCEVADGAVVRLEAGRTREEVAAEVVEVGGRDPSVVAGFDFAFSLPAWFLAERGLADVRALWALAAAEGERWLLAEAPPFWGVRGSRRPELPAHTRRTEDEAAARSGRRPSSVFKLVGADQVGRGSVRGMVALETLAAAGWAVWPFDAPPADRPVAVEIWPRLLYAEPVVKSSPRGRAEYLSRHAPGLAADHRRAAEASDDAFDALTAAWSLWARRADFAALPPARDGVERLEGRIWTPPDGLPLDRVIRPEAGGAGGHAR
jgi:hypothetical protein